MEASFDRLSFSDRFHPGDHRREDEDADHFREFRFCRHGASSVQPQCHPAALK
jgi:hypothetical protein